MKKIKKIVIHTSDSHWGTALEIDKWHRERGWSRIGYSAVITNGTPTHEMFVQKKKWHWADGQIEWGRPFDDDAFVENGEIGAHAYGWNRDRLMIEILRFVKARMLYQNDMSNWGRNEYSASASEVYKKRVDDCDGANMLVHVLARLSGVPRFMLYSAIGQTYHGGHYWLFYYSPMMDKLYAIDSTYFYDPLLIGGGRRAFKFSEKKYQTVWYLFNEDGSYKQR